MVHQPAQETALCILSAPGGSPFLPAAPQHLKQHASVSVAIAGVVTVERNAPLHRCISKWNEVIAPVINYWDTAKALE